MGNPRKINKKAKPKETMGFNTKNQRIQNEPPTPTEVLLLATALLPRLPDSKHMLHRAHRSRAFFCLFYTIFCLFGFLFDLFCCLFIVFVWFVYFCLFWFALFSFAVLVGMLFWFGFERFFENGSFAPETNQQARGARSITTKQGKLLYTSMIK